MQETKTSSCYSTVAGALFAFGGVMELFQWLRVLRFMSFSDYVQMLIWVASCAVLAFALLTKRRDIFLPVGFALAGIACLFFLNFRNVLLLLGNWGMAFLAVVFVTDYLSQLREQVKKFWFIPPAVVALATVLSIGGVWFVAFLRLLATCAGMFLAAIWIAYPEGLPQQTVSASAETGSTTTTPAPEVYCGLVKHILLLLFTCGIWLYIWIYRVTGYTNNVQGEENRNPTNKLLLCLFVPFYVIYWMYKTAQRLDKMAAAKNIPSDLSTLCLILAIFVPIIPPILMQDKLNDIVTGRVAPAAPAAAPAPAAPTSVSEAADDLLKLKELLDEAFSPRKNLTQRKSSCWGCKFHTTRRGASAPRLLTSQEGAENPLPPCIYFLMISLSFSAAVVTASLTTAAALFALAAAFSRAISLAK